MKKKSIWKVFGVLVLIILLIFSIAFCVLLYMEREDNREQINLLQYTIDSNQKTVYVAKDFIHAGEKLELGVNVQEQVIVSGLEQFNYMTAEQLGSYAKVDITANMPIMNTMLTTLEITKDTREYEMLICTLASDQANYDVVDVRIQFPNGEDYLLLSKKTIYSINVEQSVFTTLLTEEEIMRTASATIDAYINSGTRIYTTRYVEPTLQEELIPNYPVKTNLIELMYLDPNILITAQETLNMQTRLSLEERLMGLSEEWIEAIVSGRMSGYISQTTVRDAVLQQGSGNTVPNTSNVEGLEDIDPNEVFGNNSTTTTPTTTTDGGVVVTQGTDTTTGGN